MIDPVEIAQQIDVHTEPGGKFAIHVPSWFAILGVMLTLSSVAGTAISLAALWAEFRGHAGQEWHSKSVKDVRLILDAMVESQSTQSALIDRLDALERRFDSMSAERRQ